MTKELKYFVQTPPPYVRAWLKKKGWKGGARPSSAQYMQLVEQWFDTYKRAREARKRRAEGYQRSSSNQKANKSRKMNRNRLKQCGYCGKLNSSNMAQHFKRNHPNQHVKYLASGEYADYYYWASKQAFALKAGPVTRNGSGKPFELSINKQELTEHAKSQLRQARRVPYEFSQCGAVAARQLHDEGIRISHRLRECTEEDYAVYNRINMAVQESDVQSIQSTNEETNAHTLENQEHIPRTPVKPKRSCKKSTLKSPEGQMSPALSLTTTLKDPRVLAGVMLKIGKQRRQVKVRQSHQCNREQGTSRHLSHKQ